jgi:DNA-binding GntR family transcriptional regulator
MVSKKADRSLRPPVSKKPIRSLREQITDALRSEVLAGVWTNEAPMREHALAERFGVSRGPIRDALLQLSQEGVLVYSPNKGVRVNTPPAEAERLLLQSMRREMETFCIGRCMEHLTEADDEQLEGILAELTRACERADLSAIADNDLALHRYLVRRASRELEGVWQSIASRLLMDYSRIDRLDQIVAEHEVIVRAVKKRNLKAAQKAINANII